MAGVRQPSIVTLSCAALSALAVSWLAFTLITPESLAGPWGAYWSIDGADDYLYLTRDIGQIRSQPAPLAVSILGASGVEEALAAGTTLTDVISERIGLHPSIHNLTAANQTIVEMGGLFDQIADGYNGVVVFGVGLRSVSFQPQRFERVMLNPRLGFVSKILDREAAREGAYVPRRYGVYLIDNRQFYSIRLPYLAMNLIQGKSDRRTHSFLSRGQISGRALKRRNRKLRDYPGDWQRRHVENLERLGRIIDAVRSRGNLSVAILEPPANEEMIARSGTYVPFAEHREVIRSFARERGVDYWYISEKAGIVDTDFFDWAHLRSVDAQERFTRVLAEQISELLERHVRRPEST